MVNKNLIWLASYPKSGNTWFRSFLSNLMSGKEEPVNINAMHTTPIASSRALFDEYTGVSGSDLNMEEIDELRPHVFREISSETEDLSFHKVHDAWKKNRKGEPLFPPEVTKAVIYFIRDPRDVAVSFAYHSAISFDKMANQMANTSFSFCGRKDVLFNQLRQELLSWTEHVISWIDKSGLPVCTLRYEDMKADSFNTFKKAVAFIGLEYKDEDIKRAIRNSTFEKLKSMEEEDGFAEKPIKMKSFFREGKSGSYLEKLSPEIIQKIEKDHHDVMKRFGYL